MMFQEAPFMERFGAAAKAGFKAVEFMFPYEYSVAELQKVLADNDQKLVLFNMPAGNWAAGDRGIAVDPTRKAEFQAGVQKAVEYAKALGVPQPSLDSFPEAFQQGMAARAEMLGDGGESAPEHWEAPLGSADVWRWLEPAAGPVTTNSDVPVKRSL